MAEWIKLRTDLDTDPVVIAQAAALKLQPGQVAWLWVKFWGWAREHTADGRLEGVTQSVVDHVTGVTDFSSTCGKWIVFDAHGCTIPKWEKHNDQGARERFEDNERQRKCRKNKGKRKKKSVTQNRDTCHEDCDNTVTRREEKRREESNLQQQVIWSEQDGFTGVDNTQRKVWNDAYPSVNIDGELRKAHAWLVANPRKAGKRNYRKFLTNWLARGHDRGGGLFPSNKPQRPNLSDGSYADEQAVLPEI